MLTLKALLTIAALLGVALVLCGTALWYFLRYRSEPYDVTVANVLAGRRGAR